METARLKWEMKGRLKILVVEDNPELRRLYALGLNRRGFEVKLAANGAEALTRVEHERPDLVLLDLIMPVMSGWELLEKINPVDGSDMIPVIVLTGHSIEETEDMHHAVLGVLFKPITIAELVETITEKLSAPVQLPPRT
ncbi:MAG: response regulator [Thermoanaerobaculia bacterium]